MNAVLRHRLAGLAAALLPAGACAGDAAVAEPALPWFELLAPLLLLALLAVITSWWLRRRGGLLRRQGPLRLVQVLPVGPREKLLLVQTGSDENYLLIGVTPTGISALGRVSPPKAGAADDSPTDL